MCLRFVLVAAFAAAICPAPAAAAPARADIAALQVALRAASAYAGTVDGVRGPATVAAVRRVQRRAGLVVDGIAGPRTRRALGRRGRHPFGSRAMVAGDVGWDVSALQFKLAVRGFPSGGFDGVLGPRALRALRRFQRWAGLPGDGVAGRATLRALRAPPPRSPVQLLPPLPVAIGDRFGPRGARFHAGADYPAPTGTPVTSAGFGHVAFAGHSSSGWGNLVVLRHRLGLRTLYAHLSAIDIRPGPVRRSGPADRRRRRDRRCVRATPALRAVPARRKRRSDDGARLARITGDHARFAGPDETGVTARGGAGDAARSARPSPRFSINVRVGS